MKKKILNPSIIYQEEHVTPNVCMYPYPYYIDFTVTLKITVCLCEDVSRNKVYFLHFSQIYFHFYLT